MKVFFPKAILALCLVIFVGSRARADEVTFRASAPMIVTEGESFRVEFALNASPDEDSFRAPDFAGFEVLAGPVVAQGHSIQIINGAMTKSVNYTITYVLLPGGSGNFSIGAASVEVEGRTYRTRPVAVEVSAGGAAADRRAGSGREQREASYDDAQEHIGKDDLQLRVHLSRRSVFKGEPLLATFKLYRRVPIVGYEEIRFPAFDGFWTQDIDIGNAQWQRETLDGRVYESVVVKECLLYPQQSGTLVIEPAAITAVAQVVVRSRHDMDPFFGGQEVYNVRRKLRTPRVEIAVKELPAGAPEGFAGAVGRFTMEASLSQPQLAANSAGTYTIKITGQGNLSFVQAPKLALPASFEQYSVKTTELINTSASGASGYRQFEYPFIARAEGSYRIDSVQFVYFSPERCEYVTLPSPAFALEITPDGSGSGGGYANKGLSKEEVQLLGEDIRFIRLGRARLHPVREPFLFGGTYFLLLAGIVMLFAGAYFLLRKRIRDSQNAALIRGRRANKVAVQRFRAARGYMEERRQHAFYEEMLRALWGYMGDKFNIPVANLTKENVREELYKRGASPEDAQLFSDLIARCDEAQYSPAASVGMNDVYREGLELISRIESIIKR